MVIFQGQEQRTWNKGSSLIPSCTDPSTILINTYKNNYEHFHSNLNV